MDGISENMIDFAACRFFYFLLDFTAFYELGYSQERTIGHLKSELQHFQAFVGMAKDIFIYFCRETKNLGLFIVTKAVVKLKNGKYLD